MMNSNTTPPLASDGHVETLLPWYVNGTLETADSQRVQRHLEGCEQCRVSLQFESRIAGLVHDHRDTLDCAPQSGWNRLAAQLDARQPLSPSVSMPPRLRHRAGGKRLLPTLVVLQAAAIAGLGIALVQLLDQRSDNSYRTLSEVAPSQAAVAPTLRVVFADDTSSATLRTLLEPIGGTIRSGPTANSVYTIELQKAGTAAALEWLRTQPEVLFAEPVGAPQTD
jgi:hypothetical protein